MYYLKILQQDIQNQGGISQQLYRKCGNIARRCYGCQFAPLDFFAVYEQYKQTFCAEQKRQKGVLCATGMLQVSAQ
ncbi:MAG: hypothetical protein CSB28_01685 [Desulfobacterales bacterium]|nr:MAG: hypothetical protein CSB28_01685 [Desulfobacterales bacterium]